MSNSLKQPGSDPFAVVIEDAHDMDVSSWDFLRYHIGSEAPSGELWVVTHRPLQYGVSHKAHTHTHTSRKNTLTSKVLSDV